MLKFSRRYYHGLLFVPGLVLLGMGMLALHTSVKLDSEHKMLNQYYETVAGHYPDFQDSVNGRRVRLLINDILIHDRQLYWSVIAIGLTGFLLLIINADHLRKLDNINREKQETLKLLERRLAAIEASFEGIGIVDPQGRLTYMNKAFLDIYGITQAQKQNYIGLPWLNLYGQQDRTYIKDHVVPIFERNGFWRDTSKILRHNGGIVTADMSMTRLDDGGFISTARDMTESEKADAEKKEIQNQLAQAQKMEAVGRLAGGIAHDFNNILAAINGYAEFLSEDLEDKPPQKTFADNILKASHQARGLIDQILAFSRRQDGKIEKIDLTAPLQETLSMLKATLPKTIEVHADIQLENAPIEGNATQISQAIMNLCVNARDAMDDDQGAIHLTLDQVNVSDDVPMNCVVQDLPVDGGPPLIRIEDGAPGQTLLYLGALSIEHDYVRLSIADTGSGMTRKIMEHIFEPFFTTKDVHKGTGLGLASVHGTIIAHRGALFIESTLDKGTKFDLLFPVSSAGNEEQQDTQSDEIATGSGGVILLVEDQEEVRTMTDMLLKRLGYDVVCAENGLDALDKLRESPNAYDLVLTDQNMPKMTGTELVREAILDFPDLPFVILSGYSQEKLQDVMANQPAIKDVLRKPVNKKDLGKILSEILQKPLTTPARSLPAA